MDTDCARQVKSLGSLSNQALFLLAVTFYRKRQKYYVFTPLPIVLLTNLCSLNRCHFFPPAKMSLVWCACLCGRFATQPEYLGIVLGKRKFHIELIKVEVAHETGSLSLIGGEKWFFYFVFGFAALLVTSGSYGDGSRELVHAEVYCNGF